jgi:hypothetical protein
MAGPTSVKNCPYCGAKAIAVKAGISPPIWWTRCTRKACEAEGPIYSTKGDAINAWNYVSGIVLNVQEQEMEGK